MIDKDKLAAIEKNIGTTKRLLREYKNQRADILRAQDGVEELARLLWAWLPQSDEEEEFEFYERLRSDEAYRDRRWTTLTIKSEKDEWRDRAVKVIEIARSVRPEADVVRDRQHAEVVALLARHVDPEEGALTLSDSDRSSITRYLREYVDVLMQR